MLVAVNYHYIRECFETPYPSIFGVSPLEFSNQLDLLGRAAKFLSANDICDIIEGKKEMPSRAAVVTFDDGLKEQYELAWPILRKKGIPAIFFVNTKPIEENCLTTTHQVHILRANVHPAELELALREELKTIGCTLDLPCPARARNVYRYDTVSNARVKYFLNYILPEEQQRYIVGRCFYSFELNDAQLSNDIYMSKDMIRKLASNGSLGSHGHAHRNLGLLEDDIAIADFDISMKKIKEWTGRKVRCFSYPFGSTDACSRAVATRAQAQGEVKFAFTMERVANAGFKCPMFLGRFSTSDIFVPGQTDDIDKFWAAAAHSNCVTDRR